MPDPLFAPRPGAPPAGGPARPPLPPRDPALWQAAREMETSFLTEMLKSAGLGRTPEGFGGGPGEDHFASFLREEQARAMVAAGGIGLAETLYQSLTKETTK